jgi:hypothetical protein
MTYGVVFECLNGKPTTTLHLVVVDVLFRYLDATTT